ncbi:hypothetical protein HPP92_003901 [Vanilla planifolia]|uniref:TFIIB-type domain-containing protein n=1 Tax=Vanilla planifolia TaxID=51239 RepID=A0A835VKD2_VANPL|nr:hypothetical protein HPP92_003901 [Vanilla planifolia]
MVWCSHCGDDCDTVRDPDKGYVCCNVCGKVLDQDIYFSGPTFEKTQSGQSRLSGSIVHSVENGYTISRQKTFDKGKYEITTIVLHLNVGGGDFIITRAHNFYKQLKGTSLRVVEHLRLQLLAYIWHVGRPKKHFSLLTFQTI